MSGMSDKNISAGISNRCMELKGTLSRKALACVLRYVCRTGNIDIMDSDIIDAIIRIYRGCDRTDLKRKYGDIKVRKAGHINATCHGRLHNDQSWPDEHLRDRL